jgi:hypothetical protein
MKLKTFPLHNRFSSNRQDLAVKHHVKTMLRHQQSTVQIFKCRVVDLEWYLDPGQENNESNVFLVDFLIFFIESKK